MHLLSHRVGPKGVPPIPGMHILAIVTYTYEYISTNILIVILEHSKTNIFICRIPLYVKEVESYNQKTFIFVKYRHLD